MPNLRTLLVGAAMLNMCATAAQAHQVPCLPRATLLDQLAKKYGEVPTQSGVFGQAMAEILESPTGSWTMLYTSPDGMSCVMASGTAWERTGDAPLPGKDA